MLIRNEKTVVGTVNKNDFFFRFIQCQVAERVEFLRTVILVYNVAYNSD